MIKVNLLNSRTVMTAGAQADSHGELGSEQIGDFQLDEGFNTFGYSQSAQFIKLFLIIGFVVPLLVFEKIRGDEDKAIISEKRSEVQAIQDIKFSKEEELRGYEGLERKKDALVQRDAELRALRSERLKAVKSADALQSSLPESVWLLKLKFSDGNMEISGQTFEATGLDAFVKKLKRVRGFSNFNIPKDVKVKSPSGRTVNEFLLTLTVEDSLTEAGGGL